MFTHFEILGQCTNWFCLISNFDSEVWTKLISALRTNDCLQGEQPFQIDMTGAKLNIVIKFDTVDGCGENNNLVLRDIRIPINYDNIVFDFTNIGSVLGSIVDTIGNLAISFSEGIIKAGVENLLAREVPSLLCEVEEPSKMEVSHAAVNKEQEPVWHSLLLKGTQGWGWDQLKRDTLAEKFMKKVINEGFVR